MSAIVSNSRIEGGYAGTGNLSSDPLLEAGMFRLHADSPTLNVGNIAMLPADAYDLDGNSNTAEELPDDRDGQERVVNGTVDLGAYERQASRSATLDQLANLALLAYYKPPHHDDTELPNAHVSPGCSVSKYQWIDQLRCAYMMVWFSYGPDNRFERFLDSVSLDRP